MNLATFNCKSFKSKFSFFKRVFNSHDISIFIEHWLSDEEAFNQLSNQHSILFQSDFSFSNCPGSTRRRGRPFGGKCWVVKNDVKIKSHEVLNNDVEFRFQKQRKIAQKVLSQLEFGWLLMTTSQKDWQTFSLISLLESILKENQENKVIIFGGFICNLKRKKIFESFQAISFVKMVLTLVYSFLRKTSISPLEMVLILQQLTTFFLTKKLF